MTVDSGWHAVGPTMTTDARVRGTGYGADGGVVARGRYALRWASDQDMEPLAPSPHRLSHPADELPPPVTRPRLRLVLPRCMDLHDVGSDQRAWPQRWGEGSLLPSQGRTERTVRPPPSPLMSTQAVPPVARVR